MTEQKFGAASPGVVISWERVYSTCGERRRSKVCGSGCWYEEAPSSEFGFTCPHGWNQISVLGGHGDDCEVSIAADRSAEVHAVRDYFTPIRELRGPGEIRRARDEDDD